MTDQEFTVQEWVFLGYSGTSSRWRDANGKVHSYTKRIKGRVPGAVYRVMVSDDLTMRGQPEWTGVYAEDVAVLQARARAQEEADKRKRMENSTSRVGALDEAMAPLVELVRGKQASDVGAILSYVSSRIWQESARRG